jgi:hypothetical protein
MTPFAEAKYLSHPIASDCPPQCESGKLRGMTPPSTNPTAQTETRLERARRVYREYFTMCFWHWRRDLKITEETIPALVKGLRTNGNRQAYMEADILSRGE